jgi:ATP synthase, F1 delta subunit
MNELARRYASAYFELDRDADRFADTARSVMACAPLYEALISPAVDRREKERVLRRLPFFDGAPQLLHFYELLADKGRTVLLPEIVSAVRTLALESENTAVCVMRCVHAPDEARQRAIEAMLCRLHHRRAVRLEIRTEPELLGGFILEIDGVTYDRSVRGQLRDMAALLQERGTT